MACVSDGRQEFVEFWEGCFNSHNGFSSTLSTSHHRQFQIEQAGQLSNLAELMPDAQSAVMCRPLFGPAIHELGGVERELKPRVGVADLAASGRESIHPRPPAS